MAALRSIAHYCGQKQLELYHLRYVIRQKNFRATTYWQSKYTALEIAAKKHLFFKGFDEFLKKDF